MAGPKGTIVVTGANGGLGSAIAAKILSTPDLASACQGVYTVREAAAATALDKTLASAPPSHKFDKLEMDLSRLSAVREAANALNRRVASGSMPPIRALILNAGYMEFAVQTTSEDGFDMSFQCNYLSHWLFTLMLLQSMDKEEGRVVVVGSWAHDPEDSRNEPQGLYKDPKWKALFHDTESLAKGTFSAAKVYPTEHGGARRYGAGKLCEVMMIYELQKRLDSDPALSNISVLGVDPGAMPTELSSKRGSVLLKVISQFINPVVAGPMTWLQPNGFVRTREKSAGDLLRAAFDTETLGERPKRVYLNGTDPQEPSREAKDAEKGGMLWKDSVRYVGLGAGDTALVDWE